MVLGDIIGAIDSNKIDKVFHHKSLKFCKQTYVIQVIGFLAYSFQLLRTQLRPDKRCQLPI